MLAWPVLKCGWAPVADDTQVSGVFDECEVQRLAYLGCYSISRSDGVTNVARARTRRRKL